MTALSTNRRRGKADGRPRSPMRVPRRWSRPASSNGLPARLIDGHESLSRNRDCELTALQPIAEQFSLSSRLLYVCAGSRPVLWLTARLPNGKEEENSKDSSAIHSEAEEGGLNFLCRCSSEGPPLILDWQRRWQITLVNLGQRCSSTTTRPCADASEEVGRRGKKRKRKQKSGSTAAKKHIQESGSRAAQWRGRKGAGRRGRPVSDRPKDGRCLEMGQSEARKAASLRPMGSPSLRQGLWVGWALSEWEAEAEQPFDSAPSGQACLVTGGSALRSRCRRGVCSDRVGLHGDPAAWGELRTTPGFFPSAGAVCGP